VVAGETQYLNHGCTHRHLVDLQLHHSVGETHSVEVNPVKRVGVAMVQVAAPPQNHLSETCKSPPRRVTTMWSRLWARLVPVGF
jgi:hypothetical protein